LTTALAKLEEDAKTLPPALITTVGFQRLLLRIRGGAPISEWRESMGKYAASTENSPIAVGLRELALAWEARARMTEVDAALRGYYRKNIRFPAKFSDIKLPVSAQSDPWGDAWTYTPGAPKGFSQKFASQRYTLAPSKHPQVRSIEDTLLTPAPARTWKVTTRDVAGQKVIEVRTAAGATFATQPGGRVEDATVLHLGDGWVLMADLERIFTVTIGP
jgi:hypothetical protein